MAKKKSVSIGSSKKHNAKKTEGPKKVKDKAGELKARNAVDQVKFESELLKYDNRLKTAKAAREHAATPYYQKEFKARKKDALDAFNEAKKAMNIDPSKFETLKDAAPVTGPLGHWKKALGRLEEWTFPTRRDCLELEVYVLSFADAPLFEKEMVLIATWNNDKGIVEITKRKK